MSHPNHRAFQPAQPDHSYTELATERPWWGHNPVLFDEMLPDRPLTGAWIETSPGSMSGSLKIASDELFQEDSAGVVAVHCTLR